MNSPDLIAKFEAFAGLPHGAIAAEWQATQYPEAGEPEAIALVAGSEIHFAVNPQHRGRVIQRSRTREFLAPLFDRFGYLTTSVPHGDHRSERFIERLGFVETWNDQACTHFMLMALPFETHTTQLGDSPAA